MAEKSPAGDAQWDDPFADPFNCFGSDDGDDDVARPKSEALVAATAPTTTRAASKSKEEQKRSEDCGVLSFHQGTEAAMLAHVRNAVADLSLPPPTSDGRSESEGFEGSAEDIASSTVLSSVDEFCRSRHWMMHVGPEKGDIVTKTLHKSVEEKVAEIDRLLASHQISAGCFVCVELGTYCGYASVLLSRCLRAAESAILSRSNMKGSGDEEESECHPRIDFRLYTVEVNPTYAAISRELFKLARLDDMITLLEIPVEVNMLDTEDAAADVVSNQIWTDEAKKRQTQILSWDRTFHEVDEIPVSRLPQIDFLFIDHDKDSYLPDLMRLEREGLVRAGSTVVADNVIFAGINDYLEYVRRLADDGTVETETFMSSIEYADEESHDEESSGSDEGDEDSSSSLFVDGIEVTRFKRNPLAGEEDWIVRSGPRFAAMKARDDEAMNLPAVRRKKMMQNTRSQRWNSTGTTK